MKKIKVVYIISQIDKSLNFEWTAESINRDKFELIFFLIGKKDSALAKHLKRIEIKVIEFELTGKWSLASTFLRLVVTLFRSRPDVVHTHLFYANLLGLTAAFLARVPKRVFTRHHAMVHYNEYPQGLKWDKLCNRLATQIVAISDNVKNILIFNDKAQVSKITVIRHGFQLTYFEDVDINRVKTVKEKYGLRDLTYPVIGMISRYLKLKGIDYVIASFVEVRKKYPKAHLILANATGNYSKEVKLLLASLEPGSFTEILFEQDLAALYHLFHIFIHVPVDAQSEAFGQTYVEALAAGIPSIFTLSGVAPEFIGHQRNAWVVPFMDTHAITEAIDILVKDKNLTVELIANGKSSVKQFAFTKQIHELESLYEK